MHRLRWLCLLCAACCALAADYRPPAGEQPAQLGAGQSVLPGGRQLTPLGRTWVTGPGPFGLAANPSGSTVVTADGGPDRFSLTLLDVPAGTTRRWLTARKQEEDEDDWRSVFQGLAFTGEDRLYAAEGNSGRVRLLQPHTGKRLAKVELNGGGVKDSYSGDLALDPHRPYLYVLDQAHFRLVVADTRTHQVVASVPVGRLPFALALSPDGQRAYVTHVGLFRYQVLPQADAARPLETTLEFPPYGFPSREAARGVMRRNTSGQQVAVPALGDPNAAEAHSVAIVDLKDPLHPRVEAMIRTGQPVRGAVRGGSSPSGVLATNRWVYVSNAHQDSITVIDPQSLRAVREIPLRIRGLEALRGILPLGLAFDEARQRLYVAEAGLNAVGVVDTAAGKLLGHVPVAWFPTRVLVREGQLTVACAKGMGTGPNTPVPGDTRSTFQGERRQGLLVRLAVPEEGELAELTRRVLANNGMVPAGDPPALPGEIRHVVVIVKENRTFDEVLGDLSPKVNGQPSLARLGRRVTPNHHALADRFAISDNFYSDSEVSVDGHHWLAGAYPNAWTESSIMAAYGGQKDFRLAPDAPGRLQFAGSASSLTPENYLEAGSLWHHLDRFRVPFRNYGEGFELPGVYEGAGTLPTGGRYWTNMPMPDPLYRNTCREYAQYNTNVPDQRRADQFLADVQKRFVIGGEPFPRFVYIHLPNDHMADPRPADGYPERFSYVADNDYALGRIVSYLSHSPWWKQMAILITEDDAQGGVDHVDSHRTVLQVVSPYARRGYVSHRNASFPGLLKTVFRLLRLPALNLYDATAADLSDCFTDQPDFTPYDLLPVDQKLFNPALAKEPREPKPGPRMDDPEELRRQHRVP